MQRLAKRAVIAKQTSPRARPGLPLRDAQDLARHAAATWTRATRQVPLLVGVFAARLVLGAIPGADLRWLTLHSSWLQALGTAVLVASTRFTLWARRVLGIMWSSMAIAKRDPVLGTSGPYAITRHPIYTGLLGMLLGTALISGLGVWVDVLVVGIVFARLHRTQ